MAGKYDYDTISVDPWTFESMRYGLKLTPLRAYAHQVPRYTSTIATDNGLTSANLILDNTNYYEHQVFPAYPTPLASCPIKATFCAPPSTIASYLSTEVAAFAPNFVTPRVHQASPEY